MSSVVLLKSNLGALGGAEKYALRIAGALRDQGHSVSLLTSGPAQNFGVNTASYQPKAWMSFRRVQEYDRFCLDYLARQRPEIVLGLDRNSYQTHLRASNGVHAAYLKHRSSEGSLFKRCTYRLNPLHRTLLSLEKTAFEHPELKKLFTNSHMVRTEILEHYHVDPQKIEVVHNGVEWAEMQSDFDQSFEKKSSAFQFLFIGHNYKRKGLEKLLQGLHLLRNEDFQLSVVGKEKNSAPFMALARELGLENKVHFFGPQSTLRPFYQRADALVIPSLYDPFANVTVEALAMGLFVVSSKTNGAHEILNEANGTTIETLGSPDAFAAALRTALNHPKTKERATQIRASVRHLDFERQLLPFTEL
jgi:UDP-glucose:(heptosyl)LPS alpha-1,3-glucosyltransferase